MEPDVGAAFFNGLRGSSGALVSFDLRRGRANWTETLDDLGWASLAAPAVAATALAVGPRGEVLFYAVGEFLVAVDLAQRKTTAVIANLEVGTAAGMVRLERGFAGRPSVMALGAARDGRRGWVYFVDAVRIEVLDSIAIDTTGRGRWVVQVAFDPSERIMYATSTARTFAVDLTTRDVIASIPRPHLGRMAVTPSDGTLLLSDPGGFDFFGAGLILRYTPNLNPLPPFDLNSISLTGRPPQLSRPVFLSDSTALVPSGRSGEFNPGFNHPPQLTLLNIRTGDAWWSIRMAHPGFRIRPR